ncbi:MAG: 3-hydroxyacyl-CoA dehydrogenase family protein [Oscillospiraceae bacterium]
MQKIFVVGAGTMGLDIAQEFAKNGYKVTVRDISDEIIGKSKDRMLSSISKLVSRGKMEPEAAEKIKAAITFTTKLEDAADADLIEEAIVENLEIKKSLFKELDDICKPECIFASNTSSVSLTEMAFSTKRPDRFVGMHFFNPPGVMKLIEVTRAAATSEETFRTVYELSKKIGKEPVEVKEAPGFVVNRILIPMINEAACVLEEGIASAEDIDKAMKLGANHPIGPLALGDLIGIDVVVNIMQTIFNETGDQKYRPARIMKNMVRSGRLGRKTGRGFFEY